MFAGIEPTEEKMKGFRSHLNILDQLIGDNKYLTGADLTIADISMLANTQLFPQCCDVSELSNFIRWLANLQTEVQPFNEVFMSPSKEELQRFMERAQQVGYLKRKMNE